MFSRHAVQRKLNLLLKIHLKEWDEILMITQISSKKLDGYRIMKPINVQKKSWTDSTARHIKKETAHMLKKWGLLKMLDNYKPRASNISIRPNK